MNGKEAKRNMKNRRKKTQRTHCGHCGEFGHSIRTCPSMRAESAQRVMATLKRIGRYGDGSNG